MVTVIGHHVRVGGHDGLLGVANKLRDCSRADPRRQPGGHGGVPQHVHHVPAVIGYPGSPQRDLPPVVGHLAVHCRPALPAQQQGERLEFRARPICRFPGQGDFHRGKHLHVPSQKRAQQFSDGYVMRLVVLDRRKDLPAANDFHLPPYVDDAAEKVDVGFRVDGEHFALPHPGSGSELGNHLIAIRTAVAAILRTVPGVTQCLGERFDLIESQWNCFMLIGYRPGDRSGVQWVPGYETGGRARPTVVRYLYDEVGPLLRDGRYSDSVGRELFAAAAELTRLAGWMADDLELHGLAQRYLIQALRLAREADDYALGGEILAGMSHQAVYVGRADDALDLAWAAHDSAAKAAAPALMSESLIMQAHALAVSKDSVACGRALNAAELAFERSDAAGTPPWLRYFDEAYVAAKFGHCFRELGHGDKAELFARRSLDMVDGYVRGRAFNVVLLANAHLQQQSLDEACAVGNQALDLSSGLQSARTVRYIRDLRRRMSKFGNDPVLEISSRGRTNCSRPAIRALLAEVMQPSQGIINTDHRSRAGDLALLNHADRFT
jgi:hypothetical protein